MFARVLLVTIAKCSSSKPGQTLILFTIDYYRISEYVLFTIDN